MRCHQAASNHTFTLSWVLNTCMHLQVCTGALQQGRGRANKPWAGVEAAMSLRLDHASVVRTFKHTVVLLQVRVWTAVAQKSCGPS